MLSRGDAPSADGIEILKPKEIKLENKVKRNKRGAESRGWQWLYSTRRYRIRRRLFMMKNPYCNSCGKVATDLDHIIAHKGNTELFFDEDNWQSLCGTCHRRKTVTEDM